MATPIKRTVRVAMNLIMVSCEQISDPSLVTDAADGSVFGWCLLPLAFLCVHQSGEWTIAVQNVVKTERNVS